MSEKISLPIVIFVIEAMSIAILSTLGLMAATLVTISTVALVAFTWSRLGGTRPRRGRHSTLHL